MSFGSLVLEDFTKLQKQALTPTIYSLFLCWRLCHTFTLNHTQMTTVMSCKATWPEPLGATWCSVSFNALTRDSDQARNSMTSGRPTLLPES